MTRFKLAALILLLTLVPLERAQALTCADLDGAYVYSQEPSPVYLGFFGSQFASDSIINLFGTYGSEFSSYSVRNSFGSYGSSFGTYSANNDFASLPPAIYKWGDLIGYLTTNTFIFGGVSLAVIDLNCAFFASSPRTYPFIPTGLGASDGVFTDKIILAWNPASGALLYGIYYSDSPSGQKVFLGTVASLSAVVTDLTPGVTYYFWVSSVNNFGESLLSAYDSGFIGPDADGDGVPDSQDAFPNDSSEWADSDNDGIGDNSDNCSSTTNADQADFDNDTLGDACDADDDNDGVPDESDEFPLDPAETSDSDGDGVGDNADVYPLDPTRSQYSGLFTIQRMDSQGVSGLGLSLWNSIAARHIAQRIDAGTGSQINEIGLTPANVRAVESVADLNGNGVDEIIVLSTNADGFVEAKIKDGQSGDLLTRMLFEAEYRPLWLRVVPDSGNDGSVDIAVLGVSSEGRPRAQVRDALSGALVSKVYFEAAYAPLGFEVIEDLNSDGISEIAVVGVDDVGRVRAQVKDVVSGQLRSLVYFDRSYTPSHVTGVDMDGNGLSDALAVLGENDAGIVRAQVKDVATAARLGIVRFESGYTPHKLISIPDMDVSGSPELAVLQRNGFGDTRAQVKDAVTGRPVSLISFIGGYLPRDMTLVPDVDDNNYPELAFLGELGVGNYLLHIKDAVTGQAQVYQSF